MKELLFDARCMGSGIGTYSRNLIAGVKAQKPDYYIRAITRDDCKEMLAPYCDRVTTSNAPIYSIQEQIKVPWQARQTGVLHVLNYNAPLLYRGCMLVSIYDLTHVLDRTYSRTAKSIFYARPMLQIVSRRAEHIFTLSEYSKQSLIEILKVPESKITVTYCGVGSQFRSIDRDFAKALIAERLRVDRPYLLFIGNLKPHKNVVTLLRAFAGLRTSRRFDWDLVVVGDDKHWKSELVNEARSLKVADRVKFISHVAAELLPSVYAAAELLIQPSFEEGFGLPVLEAMAMGTPVVCSRAASLPEVGGEAPVYFDPKSVDDLSAAITFVLGSPSQRQEMERKGFEQANRFSWEVCVQKHCEVYEGVFT